MPSQADLSPLFAPERIGAAQPMFYLQGTIVTFDQVTLENTVSVGGSVLANLPLLGVGEAALLVPGAAVGLQVAGDQIAIVGRWVVPGTADATDATALLSSFIAAGFVLAQESTASDTYTDLATVGPSVTVTVRGTGRLLLIISAKAGWNSATNTGAAYMTAEMTGANVVAAGTVDDRLLINSALALGVVTSQATSVASSAAAVFEGLTPGETTITAKYAAGAAPTWTSDFGLRSLIAITL